MKIEELVGSLQTYEPTLPQSKKMSIALKSIKEGIYSKFDEETFNDETFSLLVKDFKKFFRSKDNQQRY